MPLTGRSYLGAESGGMLSTTVRRRRITIGAGLIAVVGPMIWVPPWWILAPLLICGIFLLAWGLFPQRVESLVAQHPRIQTFSRFLSDKNTALFSETVKIPASRERSQWEQEWHDQRNVRREFWRLINMAYKNWAGRSTDRSLQDLIEANQIPPELPLDDGRQFQKWVWDIWDKQNKGELKTLRDFTAQIYPGATPAELGGPWSRPASFCDATVRPTGGSGVGLRAPSPTPMALVKRRNGEPVSSESHARYTREPNPIPASSASAPSHGPDKMSAFARR